jgi:hypothetical protein
VIISHATGDRWHATQRVGEIKADRLIQVEIVYHLDSITYPKNTPY